MDKRTISRIAGFVAGLLEERGIRVSNVILFGSFAHGNYSKDSDVDLAVISEDFHGKDIFERADMLGDAGYKAVREFKVPLDLVTMSPEDLESGTSIVSGFVNQGKVVYPSPAKRRAGKKYASA